MAITIGRLCTNVFNNYNVNREVLRTVRQQIGLRYKSKYKAAVLQELKTPLVIEERNQEKLKKDEVRIKVRACSVNASDLMICNGVYDVAPKLPFVPGYEVSGKVIEVGSESDDGLEVGSRVVGLNKDNFSAFAEECVLSTQDVWELPSELDYRTAVSLVDSYSTALIGLCRRAQLKETDKVLITAAAGGVGLAAVDIAANVFRAKVIAVCDTEDKASLLREKGAWAALTNSPKDIVKKCDEVTEKRGVRIVFESIGSAAFDQLLKCVAPEGVVIVAGTASRLVTTIKTSDILPISCSLIGVSLRNYRKYNPSVYRQVVQDAIDMAEQGLVTPVIAEQFPLDKVNEAMQFVQDKKSTGKVVISMKQDD